MSVNKSLSDLMISNKIKMKKMIEKFKHNKRKLNEIK